MRRSEKEITDEKIIRSVFERGEICRLGMVDGDMAYIVPMNFGYGGEALWFHSAGSGKKIALIRNNPRVSFEIDVDHRTREGKKGCDWTASYLSVMGTGYVEFITDKEMKRFGLNRIMKKYSGKDNWGFSDQSLDTTLVFRVVADHISCKGSD